MILKDLAEKLQWIPVAHLFSWWYFTRECHSYFKAAAIAMIGALFMIVISMLLPFIPDSIESIFFFISLYAAIQAMILTARKFQANRHPKKIIKTV